MNKFLLATNNEHKAKEFREILSPLNIEVLIPKDLGICLEPDETGESFEENSFIKAKAFFEASKLITIADDSGLCIDSLNGGPGIYSARYATENGGYPAVFDVINRELLNKDRSAHFHCCICLYDGEQPKYFKGNCFGYLLKEPVGKGGFGYDPLFHSNEGDLDFGTATEEEKNRYSHRAKALSEFANYLKNLEK